MSSSHPHLSSPSTSFHPPSIDPHPSIGLDDDVAELQLDGDGDDDSLHPTTVDDTEPLDLEADDDAYSPQHQLDTQTHSLPSPHPPQPVALPPAPPPPPAAVIQPVKQAASSPRTSLSSRSAAKEREQRVILPITAAPITRQNQDRTTVVGIQPHHVDFEESGEDEDEEQQQLADGTERGEIWYEQELEEDDDEEEEEVWKAPTIDTTRDNDREVSDIMSRTPSYSQQRAKELAIVAAIKAEKERYPGQIITSPPSIPPTSATSSSSSSTTSASSTTKAKAASTIAAVAKVGQEGGPSPAFSYPGGGYCYERWRRTTRRQRNVWRGKRREAQGSTRVSLVRLTRATVAVNSAAIVNAAITLAVAELRHGVVWLGDVPVRCHSDADALVRGYAVAGVVVRLGGID